MFTVVAFCATWNPSRGLPVRIWPGTIQVSRSRVNALPSPYRAYVCVGGVNSRGLSKVDDTVMYLWYHILTII